MSEKNPLLTNYKRKPHKQVRQPTKQLCLRKRLIKRCGRAGWVDKVPANENSYTEINK